MVRKEDNFSDFYGNVFEEKVTDETASPTSTALKVTNSSVTP
jgi:hypothetical protein